MIINLPFQWYNFYRKGGKITELTKNSETVLWVLYKIYKQRINSGSSIVDAIKFSNDTYETSFELWQILKVDYEFGINSLKNKGLVKKDILNNVKLTEDAIALCENRKWTLTKEILNTVSNFI